MAGGAARHALEIHVVGQRPGSCANGNAQMPSAPAHVRAQSTTICRSKRPGRVERRGRAPSGPGLVAAIRITPFVGFEAVHLDQQLVEASARARSWSAARWARRRAMAARPAFEFSSTKMMQGRVALTPARTDSRTARGADADEHFRPKGPSRSSRRNGTPVFTGDRSTREPSSVLPEPGGPEQQRTLGKCVRRGAGTLTGGLLQELDEFSCSSCLASSQPATSLKVTLGEAVHEHAPALVFPGTLEARRLPPGLHLPPS